MFIRLLLTTAVISLLASTAGAAVKVYDASTSNGTPGDQRRISINLCPPLTSTPDSLGGNSSITDNGTGTVTLTHVGADTKQITDLSGDILVPIFGPGAFIFIDGDIQREASGNESNASGEGAHGPSSTAPGSTTEWGVVTGWTATGVQFCISSPVTICNQNGFVHGQTTVYILPSTSYNLGTWNFDASGDMEAETWFLIRTSNGGLSNNHYRMRGVFVGAALPALPLIGFGALALSLAIVGGRSLIGKK